MLSERKPDLQHSKACLFRAYCAHISNIHSQRAITFYPYASLTKHAPESNEGDYAFYLPAAHKNDRPKDTWYIWQVRRGKADWSPLHLWNNCLAVTTLRGDNIQTCTRLCINSFRRNEGTKKGVRIVTQTVYVSTAAHRQKPHAPPPYSWHTHTSLYCRSDWIQNHKMFFIYLSDSIFYITQKVWQLKQKEKKSYIESQSKVSV